MAAVEAAAEAFKTWSQTGPGERRALLLKAADALEAKTPQFIEAVAAETGATGMWAGFNVMLAAGMIREAASLTTQIGGEVIPSDVPGSLAMGVRQPAGVVLGIAPWNAPIILGVRAIATPLACGNTVILKGSRELPAHAPADRRGLPGRRLPARRGELHHQRAGRRRRGGRGDGGAPGGAARQLHRLARKVGKHHRA